MNVRRWQDNPNELEPLAAQAMNYALHMMAHRLSAAHRHRRHR